MRKPPIVDAEFEVVSGPAPVRWQARKAKRPLDILTVGRYAFAGLIILIALYTALLGLAGADLDTRPEPATAIDPANLPPDTLAIPPVPRQ